MLKRIPLNKSLKLFSGLGGDQRLLPTIYVLSKCETNIEHFQLKIEIFTVIKIRSILHRHVIVIMYVHSNVYIAFEDVL